MVILPAVIEAISTRRDRTFKIIIGTSELPPSESAALLSLHQKASYVAIKPELFSTDETQALDTLKAEAAIKSPSQRLRGILYLCWESEKKGYSDFNSYYAHIMEGLIDHFKKKLPQ